MKPLTHAEYMAMRRFPALDGMRAISALMVVFYHYAGVKWTWLQGWIGVDVFFVLSGFLITTLGLREEDRVGRVSLREFYLRRIFRILPVYFAVLAVVVALAGLRREYTSSGLSREIVGYLTFMNEYPTLWGAPFGQSWTLGIEQKFYLVWPLIAFAAIALLPTRGSASLRTGARIVLTTATMAAAIAFVPGGYGVNYCAILLGGLMAVILHHPVGFRLLSPLTTPAAGVVVAAAFIALHASIPDDAKYLGARPGFVFLYAVGVALLLPSVLGPGPVRWALSGRVMSFLGERSYSIYLVQGVAALVVGSTVPALAVEGTLTAIVVSITAMIMADQLYRWVEVPMIDQGRRVITRGRRVPTPAPGPAVARPQDALPAKH